MTTKKKSYAARLGVLALALTLVTTCLLGGTMARYVTEVTGTATASVAAWSFKANGNEDGKTFTAIDLGSTSNRTSYMGTDIKNGVIAPGTTGKFDIVIDGSGSEVGIDYSVAIAAASGSSLPDDLVFSTAEITQSNTGNKLADFKIDDGTIDYSGTASDMKKTITVYWQWDFGTSDTKDASSNDNTYADKEWTLDITVTGKQTTPEVPST